MTTRTIQFYGTGYGTTPVSITVTANGNTVFDGPITTVNDLLPTGAPDPSQFVVIFTTETTVAFSGSIPMTVTVNSGEGISVAQVRANYTYIQNPIYSNEQWTTISADPQSAESLAIETALANPPFSQSEIDTLSNPSTTQTQYYTILTEHGVAPYIMGGPSNFNAGFWDGDCRANVTLNGNPLSAPDPRPSGLIGDWTWIVPVNSTLAFDLMINQGVE